MGLGVVGRKTEIASSSSPSRWPISPFTSVAMKTSDHTPFRGYSISPARRKVWLRSESAVSKICFSAA